jgi:hypothetical protein
MLLYFRSFGYPNHVVALIHESYPIGLSGTGTSAVVIYVVLMYWLCLIPVIPKSPGGLICVLLGEFDIK